MAIRPIKNINVCLFDVCEQIWVCRNVNNNFANKENLKWEKWNHHKNSYISQLKRPLHFWFEQNKSNFKAFTPNKNQQLWLKPTEPKLNHTCAAYKTHTKRTNERNHTITTKSSKIKFKIFGPDTRFQSIKVKICWIDFSNYHKLSTRKVKTSSFRMASNASTLNCMSPSHCVTLSQYCGSNWRKFHLYRFSY